jgi:signal transduction histidine kinase
MIDAKQQVIESIVQAHDRLEAALSDLERLPAFDPSSVPFAAHALSNFLSVAEGTVELLQQSLRDNPDPKIARWLEGLRHATALMTHTVTQLANNVPIGELKFRFEKIDLSQLVHRACEYYQRLALRKSIRLLIEDQADLPLVWADRVAVAAVMDNLLSNAVKYSPMGKSVTVALWKLEGNAVCSVRDKGPGISSSDQERLFQRGVQLAAVPTGGESSSGYGLAVVKEIIEQLGGKIWVESTIGQGASFSFSLPRPQGAQKE